IHHGTCRLEGRGESAFIGDKQAHPISFLAKFSRAVIHLRALDQGFVDCLRGNWDDQNILDRYLLSCVLAPAQEIDCQSRQSFHAVIRQPSPRYRRRSPSLSSTASNKPREAPEATDPVAMIPVSSLHRARTVGRPRLSRISIPSSSSITDTMRSPS